MRAATGPHLLLTPLPLWRINLVFGVLPIPTRSDASINHPAGTCPGGGGLPVPFLKENPMSLMQQGQDWLRSVIGNHVGKNIRRYTWTTYVGERRINQLGGVTYLSPIEGKVVQASELFTLVKTGANAFCIILNSLLSKQVQVGDKVAVRFYNLRRFDGTLADGSEDPAHDGARTISLTGASTQFPVKWKERHLGINARFSDAYTEIRNPHLCDMLTQMESMPVNGGLRRVVNVLVDANAHNLEFVDPTDENILKTPPAVRTSVVTKKFVGQVEVFYDRGMDYYGVRLTPMISPAATTNVGAAPQLNAAGDATVIDNISFDDVGEVLLDLIDDGSWTLAQVTVLKAAPKAKVTASAVDGNVPDHVAC